MTENFAVRVLSKQLLEAPVSIRKQPSTPLRNN